MSGVVNNRQVGKATGRREEINDFMQMVNEDLTDVILDTDEFAFTVYFNLKGVVDNLPIPGIFDIATTMIDPDTGIEVVSTVSSLQCAVSTFTHRYPEKDDTIIIRGRKYNILTCEPDGTGMFNITLEKTNA